MIVNLDEISRDGAVMLGGVTHPVKPMSAKMLTVLRSDGDNVDKLLTIVGDRAPSLTRDMLLELSLAQLSAILDVSNESVEKVEQAAPNGEGAPPPSIPV